MENSEELEQEQFQRRISCKRTLIMDSKMALDSKKILLPEGTLTTRRQRTEPLERHKSILKLSSNTDYSDLLVNHYMTIMCKRALDRIKKREPTSTPLISTEFFPLLNAIAYFFVHSENETRAVSTFPIT